MNEIIAILVKYGIQLGEEVIATIEPIAIADAKKAALVIANNMLVTANHLLVTATDKELHAKLFHGKIIDEVEVKLAELWVAAIKYEIGVLSA